MRRTAAFCPWLVSLVLAAAACGGSGGSKAPASNITITGTLTPMVEVIASPARARASVASSPFAGYQLYCVTFSRPPVTGTATADGSGAVSLTLAAQDTPFGCFVLDTTGAAVASLMFQGGAETGETVEFSASADLGNIAIDTTTGVAAVTLPGGGTVVTTTPSGAACPAGTWSFNVTDKGAPDGTGTIWIAAVTASTFTASVNVSGGAGGVQSFAGLPLTYSNGTVVTGSFHTDPVNCPTKTAVVTMTVNAGCTAMTGTIEKSSCPADCGCDSEVMTATRQ